MAVQFEWDESKAESNLRKHGITFEEAITVFGDPISITMFDAEHSAGEDRFIDIGLSAAGRILVLGLHRARRADSHHRVSQGSRQGTGPI